MLGKNPVPKDRKRGLHGQGPPPSEAGVPEEAKVQEEIRIRPRPQGGQDRPPVFRLAHIPLQEQHHLLFPDGFPWGPPQVRQGGAGSDDAGDLVFAPIHRRGRNPGENRRPVRLDRRGDRHRQLQEAVPRDHHRQGYPFRRFFLPGIRQGRGIEDEGVLLRSGGKQPEAGRREHERPAQADIPQARDPERIQAGGAVFRRVQPELEVPELNRRQDAFRPVHGNIRGRIAFPASSEEDTAEGGGSQTHPSLIKNCV